MKKAIILGVFLVLFAALGIAQVFSVSPKEQATYEDLFKKEASDSIELTKGTELYTLGKGNEAKQYELQTMTVEITDSSKIGAKTETKKLYIITAESLRHGIKIGGKG